jgi:hypothetical protein
MNDFLQGATMMGSFAVAVFFIRYWRQTHDRLFGVFAGAFLLYGANRIALAALDPQSEARTWVYLLRALTFLAIIAAIIDKNLRPPADDDAASRQDPGPGQPEP